MDSEVFYVGVRFDPAQDRTPHTREQQRVIVALMKARERLSGKTPRSIYHVGGGQCIRIECPLGTLITCYDASEWMVGFGIEVNSTAEGRRKIIAVRDWLTSQNITSLVSVWVWSPRRGRSLILPIAAPPQ